MDPVFSDPASCHYYKVAGIKFLDMRGLSVNNGRHYPACPAIYQRLPEISVIKHYASVHSGDAAFVPAMLNATPDPFKNPLRMKEPWWQRFIIERRGKAKNVSIKDQTRSYTCTKRIAVYSNNPGNSSSIWVKCRRRIMGFNLHYKIVIIVKLYYPCVVSKNRYEPGFVDFTSCFFYKSIKKRVYGFFCLIFRIGYLAIEYFMFAVLGP